VVGRSSRQAAERCGRTANQGSVSAGGAAPIVECLRSVGRPRTRAPSQEGRTCAGAVEVDRPASRSYCRGYSMPACRAWPCRRGSSWAAANPSTACPTGSCAAVADSQARLEIVRYQAALLPLKLALPSVLLTGLRLLRSRVTRHVLHMLQTLRGRKP